MRLAEALRDCTPPLLRRIAAAHGLQVGEDSLRAELLSAVAERLSDPAHLAEHLASLSEEETRVLQAVRAAGWLAKAFVLDRRFPGRGAAPGERRRPGLGPALALLHRGLLFRTFAPIGAWRGEVLYVPEELRPAVSGFLPPPRQPERPDLRPSVAPATEEDRDCVFDVFCLLTYLRRQDRRAAQGSLAAADLARLEMEARAGEARPAGWEDRWRFLLQLCLNGGWVRRDGAVVRPGRGAESLLSGARGEVRARLVDRYLKDRAWSDLAAAGRVRPLLGGRAVDELQARRLLLHLLEELASDSWTDEAAFVETVRGESPDLLREDFASPAAAMVDVASGSELYGPGSWDAVEAGWIRYLLRGPLRWLGVVRWGLAADGSPVAFRFVGAGGAKGREEPTGEGAGGEPRRSLAFGDLREVLAPAEMDLGILYRLEPYMELRSRGRTSSYGLARASVLAGLEKGGSWQELSELLRSGFGGLVPEPLAAELAQWARSYGRYRSGSALVLTVADAQDLESLRGIPGIDACLESRLGPTSFMVVPERVWELAERLRRAGHMPRVEPGVRVHAARAAAREVALLKESLFALLLLRSLQPGLQVEDAAVAVRALEAALEPEEAQEVARRAREAAARLRRR